MTFTLMPFLYQTRTILRVPTYRASAVVLRSYGTRRRLPAERDVIPFEYEPGVLEESLPVAEETKSTITPTERQIFERIFADIEARGLKPTVKDDPSAPASASRSAMLIMQQATQDAGQGRQATVTSPAVLSGAAKDRAKALLRFPPPLRGAASKALNTIISQATKESPYNFTAGNSATPVQDEFIDDDWKAPPHTFARTVEIEAKRYPERVRVEGLITSAKSDFELWDILEKEVFTLPARLGITSSSKPAKTRGRKPRSKTAPEPVDEKSNVTEVNAEAASTEAASTEAAGTEAAGAEAAGTEAAGAEAASPEMSPATTSDNSDSKEPEKLSLYVHGPLYPAYLLLALRRLNTAFDKSSPLVFSILPRIKELGLESYVLGVSTPFFNDLLEIHWARYGDLTGMFDLLEEMRHCGLYFDKRTAAILDRADEVVSDLASPKGRSGFGRGLMMMPEYEYSQRSRIQHWQRVVKASAVEKLEDIDFVETVEAK